MTNPTISLEFFPPKNLEGAFRLWDTVQVLAPLKPRFVSVTYGAGGTTRELTRDAVAALHKITGMNVAAHLTCVDATKAETMDIAESFFEAGVSEIVALRGDPPKGSDSFVPHAEGFASSVELIEALAEKDKFQIRVGAYPEKHPEAADQQADINWLKAKVDAGAHEALTQFFFEPEAFLRFRDNCVKAGINAPITPGILPIENWKGARNFAKRCGTQIPAWLDEAFEKAGAEGRQDALAVELSTKLCQDLMKEGVNDLHFYTLNRPELTRDVCAALGITAETQISNAA